MLKCKESRGIVKEKGAWFFLHTIRISDNLTIIEGSDTVIVKRYPVEFEVAGPLAMFTRPDTGSSPVSYPIPTASALKGMFECVAFSNQAYFKVERVEICTPVRYERYTTNYGGPLRKSGTSNFQLFATVLSDVCYKVYGEVVGYASPTHLCNEQHKLQAVFMKRLKNGGVHSTPFLGWREFVPSYFGPLRQTTHVEKNIDLEIQSVLDAMYDRPTQGGIAPLFKQRVRVKEGVVSYVE